MKNKEIYRISESISLQQDLRLINVIAVSVLFLNLSAILPKKQKEIPNHQKDNKESTSLDLENIHELESNSGKNFKHPIVEHGLNRGDRAGGGFGVMPITARETINKNPSLRKKYGRILSMSNKEITIFLNNNQKASKDIASAHWNRLLKVFPKDRLRRAYAWNCGITCALKASNKEVINSVYVKKFVKVSNK